MEGEVAIFKKISRNLFLWLLKDMVNSLDFLWETAAFSSEFWSATGLVVVPEEVMFPELVVPESLVVAELVVVELEVVVEPDLVVVSELVYWELVGLELVGLVVDPKFA